MGFSNPHISPGLVRSHQQALPAATIIEAMMYVYYDESSGRTLTSWGG